MSKTQTYMSHIKTALSVLQNYVSINILRNMQTYMGTISAYNDSAIMSQLFNKYPGITTHNMLAWYTFDKKLHSHNDNPALISYYDDTRIYCKYWYRYGILYRCPKKPINIVKNGDIEIEQWHTKTDGDPEIIGYHENGNVRWKNWCNYPKSNSIFLMKMEKNISSCGWKATSCTE